MSLTTRLRRDASVIAAVVLIHVLALWGLHKASLGKPLQVIVPARLLAEFFAPAPSVALTQAAEPTPQPNPAPAPLPRSHPAVPTLAVADAPLTALRPVRPSPRSEPPAPEASKLIPLQPQAQATQPVPQMPEVVVRSSSLYNDSLNPAPVYPATSRQLREAGRVVVRVLIGTDGRPIDVVLQRSSGHDQLDQVSLETVRGWRFDPAAYQGTTDTRWVHVPINFVLE
ncbi:energy transducer TonB [Ottowia testudinis]|uniref:Energy transducer TonB n=1 Tax=Ottowia testudinis TaxID=2816950 RepID=A0A975CMU3_9BURK|nr:energy transducer TonB [Ottowia testudinis]QTD46393.1 energy transducer TonB [Ottowia testudinis]